MAQQSSGECASANPTREEEDARVQERWIRAKISFRACSSLQHLQRPTPSHLSKNAPSLSSVGNEHVACGRCGQLKICQFDNVTTPSPPVKFRAASSRS